MLLAMLLEDFGDEIIVENFKKVIVLGLHAIKINNQGDVNTSRGWEGGGGDEINFNTSIISDEIKCRNYHLGSEKVLSY